MMPRQSWLFVDDDLQEFAPAQFEFTHACIALARVGDYGDCLLDEELTGYASMTPVRQRTFATGRFCAHLALEEQLSRAVAVARRGRLPCWPAGITGSIAHTSLLASAVVSKHYTSIGIDLEKQERVSETLFEKLFTASEISALSQSQHRRRDATRMFSAKEAAYKAVHQLAGKYIGFQEAEVHMRHLPLPSVPSSRPRSLSSSDGISHMSQPRSDEDGPYQFRMRYVGNDVSNRVMETGRGLFIEHLDHVMSLFVIE